eukprot:7977878-Heterocapsa_arctica.AAC.1
MSEPELSRTITAQPSSAMASRAALTVAMTLQRSFPRPRMLPSSSPRGLTRMTCPWLAPSVSTGVQSME